MPDPAATRRYPISGGGPHRRSALAASLLLHVAVACAVTLWLRHQSPVPNETEQSVQMVFQSSSAEAPSEAPPVEAAPTPPEPSPQPAAEIPPAPPVPPPPVEVAPPPPEPPPQPEAVVTPTPAVPAPPPSMAEQPDEAPRLPPPPMPAPRPQRRPAVRAHAAPQPAPSAAAAAPAPAAAAPPTDAPPAAVSSNWRQQLAAWLAAHKTYPEEARRRGEEGSVTLRFTVERSGRVAETMVVHGSGSTILDAAAAGMLRNATLPPFPAAMSQDSVAVTVQVRFALTN